MAKKVLVISTSIRNKSNSELLARSFYEGVKSAGHDVKFLSLKDKNINFCKGCLACQKVGTCVIDDDMRDIVEIIRNSDVIVFSTPIYYYEMCGQMKVLLDRTEPLYKSDYNFREVYLLCNAAEEEDFVFERAKNGILGWIECFEENNVRLISTLYAGGFAGPEDIKGKEILNKAYAMGFGI